MTRRADAELADWGWSSAISGAALFGNSYDILALCEDGSLHDYLVFLEVDNERLNSTLKPFLILLPRLSSLFGRCTSRENEAGTHTDRGNDAKHGCQAQMAR